MAWSRAVVALVGWTAVVAATEVVYVTDLSIFTVLVGAFHLMDSSTVSATAKGS